jgi:hypothetical protein
MFVSLLGFRSSLHGIYERTVSHQRVVATAGVSFRSYPFPTQSVFTLYVLALEASTMLCFPLACLPRSNDEQPRPQVQNRDLNKGSFDQHIWLVDRCASLLDDSKVQKRTKQKFSIGKVRKRSFLTVEIL